MGLTNKERTIELKSIAKKAFEEKIIVQAVYDDLISRINNNEFRITIVGEFSSGKSTLIDALIGKDILPHSTSETTATLTYIHSIEHGHPKENKAEIFFADGKTKLVDFSTLKEYVTAFSQTIDVFSSIEYVDIYIHIGIFDNNIVIVDTPGLNGTNHYEDRTLQEIAKADASIFVFSPSGIKATELSFMKDELLKHQRSFFYVMNRIDDLRKSEGDSVESKLKELAKDISARFFDGNCEVTNLFGVSALKALAAKDTSIKKLYVDDHNTLTNEDRVRLWEESRFDLFLDSLENYLTNEKESVFVNSLATQLFYEFEDCLQHIEQSLIANLPKEELPAATIIKDEIETAQSRFENYGNGLEKNVNARLDNVEKNLKRCLANVIDAGKIRLEEVIKQINSIKTIEDFYRTFGEDGSKSSTIVNSFYDRHYESIKNILTKDIISVRNDMFLEIRKLIPNIAEIKKAKVETVNIGKKTFTYQSSDNSTYARARIKECEDRIQQLNKKQDEAFKEKARIDSTQSALERQASELSRAITSVNYRIVSLGRRPDARPVTRYRSVKVERAKLSLFRLFGSKYTTELQQYTDYDYSAQNEYDRNKSNLESERNSLSSQLFAINQQKDSLPDMEFELQSIARDIERQVKEIDYQLKEIQRYEEAKQKEMAAGRVAFLNSRKTTLINMLQTILADEQSILHRSLKNDSLQTLKELRGNLVAIIRNYFKEESNNYINQLNIMLSNISSTIENKEIEHKRTVLNSSKNNILTLMKEVEALMA